MCDRIQLDPQATEAECRCLTRAKEQSGPAQNSRYRGFAFLVYACDYYGITDPEIHALVGNGRCRRDRIQHLLCQACGTSFSTRKCTMMNHLKPPIAEVDLAMEMISEGMDISKTARILEKHFVLYLRRFPKILQNHAQIFIRISL